MKFSADYNKILTWVIVGIALILIIVSIYFSYSNTRQYYQSTNSEQATDDLGIDKENNMGAKETSATPPDQSQDKPPPDPAPPPAENPPWLDGPSDNDPPPGDGNGSGNEPWNQGPSD